MYATGRFLVSGERRLRIINSEMSAYGTFTFSSGMLLVTAPHFRSILIRTKARCMTGQDNDVIERVGGSFRTKEVRYMTSYQTFICF